MKKWGMLITGFYFCVVAGLLAPGILMLNKHPPSTLTEWLNIYHNWLLWIWIGILVGGEALLLFLSVDASQKRLKPRQHVLASVAVIALMVALLMFAGALSLFAAVLGDQLFDEPFGLYFTSELKVIGWVLALWCAWGAIFWTSLQAAPPKLTQLLQQLMKGSVLELLIAVPAHVIVRRRDDCSAPAATSFGIATGLAVMLLCFGPGSLLLLRDRLRASSKKRSRQIS